MLKMGIFRLFNAFCTFADIITYGTWRCAKCPLHKVFVRALGQYDTN